MAKSETDFSFEAEVDAEAGSEKEAAKDVDGIPYCCDHHCRMIVSSGGKKASPTTYFKCPVKGCECKAQAIKTARPGIVPAKPLCCPRCPGGSSVCVRNPNFSDSTKVVLQCPGCGWKSNALATPQFANAHIQNSARHSRPVAGIGDR